MNNTRCEPIRHAVDARLSGVEASPDFERNVFRRVRGEMKMKRKLSTAFVMAAALVLTATAVLATSIFSNISGGQQDLQNTYSASSATQEIIPTATMEALPTETPTLGPVPAQWHPYDANPGYILSSSYSVFTETGLTGYNDYTQYTASVEFIISDAYCGGKEPVWLVTFSLDDMPVFKVLRGFRGHFIDAVPANKEFTKTNNHDEILRDDIGYFLYNAQGAYFYDWTLEEKAVFSRRWVPTAEQFKARNPYFTGEGNLVWAWTRRVYGLPDEGSIALEEALNLAAKAAQQLDTDEIFAQTPDASYTFYDITDPQQPLWLVILGWQANFDPDSEDDTNYCFVTLDAQTGAVLDVYEDYGKGSIDTFLGKPFHTSPNKTATETPEVSETILTDRVPAEEHHDYDATEEEALAAARNVLTEKIGLSADDARRYTAEAAFFYSVWYNYGEEPVWHVTFSLNGAPEYKVLLGYNADYIDWALAHHEFNHPYRIEDNVWDVLGDYTQFINEQGIDFFSWTLEEKAAFSAKWRPIANQYKAEHPYFTGARNNFWLWTRRVHGLPSETDMQQNTALAIAQEHLKLYGETDETLSQIDDVQYFFDVTEPERPQWRIIVQWNTDIANHNVERERQYFIKINAVTGEVLDTIFSPQGIDNNDIRNAFIGEP